jgi:hypothetical protein
MEFLMRPVIDAIVIPGPGAARSPEWRAAGTRGFQEWSKP